MAVFILAGSSPALRIRPQEPDAEKILARMQARLMGKAEIDKVANLVVKGTCVFELKVPGANVGPKKGAYAEYVARPRLSYSVTDFPGFGKFEEGCGKRLSWEIDPMQGVRIRKSAEEALARRLIAIALGEVWTELYEKARFAGTDRILGHESFVLEMTPKIGSPERWYVGRESHVLDRIDMRMVVASMGPEEQEVSVSFSDYRPVDGILHPFKRHAKFGVAEITFHCESIRQNVEIEASRFDPPERVLDELVRLAKQALETPKTDAKAGAKPASKSEVTVKVLPVSDAATIRIRCTPQTIGKNMADIMQEVIAHLTKLGVSPAGPPFTIYHEFSADGIDLEAGFPVPEAIREGGRVKASKQPGGRVATLLHVGDYKKLSVSYQVLQKWLDENKVERRGKSWEQYLSNPKTEPDSSKWKTLILWPIK